MTLTAEGMKGAPDVSARFEIRDGVPEVVDFRITARPDGRAVRTADLNSRQLLEWHALNSFLRVGSVRRTEAGTGRQLGASDPRDDHEEWAMRGDLERAGARRGGPSKAELEEVAKVYRQAIHGRPRHSDVVRTLCGLDGLSDGHVA